MGFFTGQEGKLDESEKVSEKKEKINNKRNHFANCFRTKQMIWQLRKKNRNSVTKKKNERKNLVFKRKRQEKERNRPLKEKGRKKEQIGL